MKLSIKLLIVAAAISFSACKSGDKKDKDAKTEYGEASNEDANQIVEYNNVLVSFTDKNNEYLKRVDENLEKISKGLQNPSNQFAFIGIISPFYTPSFNHSRIKPENPPAVLSSSDQKFFKDNVNGLNETLTKIKDTYKSLNDYLKAEDWKDDKGVKGKGFIDSIYTMTKAYYKYDENVLAKLEVIGDDAERIILKTHPLKDYIFAMKDDRKAVGDFNRMMLGSKHYKTDEPKIKAAYTALEAQYKKHTEMDMPSTSKFPGKEAAFKRFNDSFNDYLVESRKVMRDAGASGKLSVDNAEDLIRKYDFMRTTYNNFVD
ncbi:DUF3829 domain-containing protein [Pedobacter sp. G11]|uniref:DUF3829 domain-containing protein n=1 Tax=Pedobacter sp. G11 TaxID=2482728 RepID=UPI000F5E6072|nr:DUF3829 domain-containing protein [Pedobacter sp. G11]AZI26093.1 DUF3829 domain-containing protein [Pedobacter sp. G11]